MVKKIPNACENIEDIRNEIDRIDRTVIELLGLRFQYVKEIVKYKTDHIGIVAIPRYNAVLENRRNLAEENGLNPDLIEKMWKMMMDHFIQEEIKILEERKNTE